MRALFRPMYAQQAPVGPYICGTCGGNHHSEQCPALQYQPVAQEGQILWCDACSVMRVDGTTLMSLNIATT